MAAAEDEPETAAGSLAAGGPSALGGGSEYPPPYTRYENFPSITGFPYRTVGVLFSRQYGVPYRCGAASIGNAAVWTARHCVHGGEGSPEGWSTDFLFVPASQAGKKPKSGRFAGSFAVTTSEWHGASEFGRDIGGVVLQKAGKSRVSDRVGALGFAWNQPPESHWFVFVLGYPAGAPFDGSRQIVCAASFADADDKASPSATGIGCDPTGGSSGGPWLLGLSNGSSGNFLTGNVSYRYQGFPEELHSPYFDDLAKALRDCRVESPPGSAAC